MKTLGELYDELNEMRTNHKEAERLAACGSPRAADHREEYEALREKPLIEADETDQAPRLVVPDGWVLVPREPTPEMCTAGYAANEKWPSEHCDTQREWVYSVSQPRWAAMIKAAPKPPQT